MGIMCGDEDLLQDSLISLPRAHGIATGVLNTPVRVPHLRSISVDDRGVLPGLAPRVGSRGLRT